MTPIQGTPRTYHCGTLTYSLGGLAVLFAWLLWGDFCYQLMELVLPTLVPLKLKSLGVSSTLMSVAMTTLPGVLNATVCPWVSCWSDRHRGRWGRRIPFIMATMPFLCLFLVTTGWSAEIGDFLRLHVAPFKTVAPATMTIVLLITFMTAFQFFNMFVGSVFFYLFNDVVPTPFLGRFSALFRMVSTGSAAVYNGFIFQFGESHFREIITGAALLYLVGFGVVCMFVKEGTYPPPPESTQPHKGSLTALFGNLRMFARESFTCRFYWYIFILTTVTAMGTSIGLFEVFKNKELGLDLAMIGRLNGIGGIAMLVAMYFAAVYIDRWHPLRILTYMAIFAAVSTGCGDWIWLTVSIPGEMFFWMGIAGIIAWTFGSAMSKAAEFPLIMRLLPHSRFGQFCSANAMIRSLGTIVSGLLAGAFVDGMLWLYHGSSFAYRYVFLWRWLFSVLRAILLVLLYREWKRLGGDQTYAAPAPWNPDGVEPMPDTVATVPPSFRLVNMAMRFYLAIFVVNIVTTGVLVVWMRQQGLRRDAFWNEEVILPLMLLTTVVWVLQLRSVRNDFQTVAAGGRPKYGLLHHGVLLVMGLEGLVAFPTYWLQLVWVMHPEWFKTVWVVTGDRREHILIVFGLAMLLGKMAYSLVLHLLRLMEREPELRVSAVSNFEA